MGYNTTFLKLYLLNYSSFQVPFSDTSRKQYTFQVTCLYYRFIDLYVTVISRLPSGGQNSIHSAFSFNFSHHMRYFGLRSVIGPKSSSEFIWLRVNLNLALPSLLQHLELLHTHWLVFPLMFQNNIEYYLHVCPLPSRLFVTILP